MAKKRKARDNRVKPRTKHIATHPNTPTSKDIRAAREGKGLRRREVVAMVPELKGESDLLEMENDGKHLDSHARVEAVKAALGM